MTQQKDPHESHRARSGVAREEKAQLHARANANGTENKSIATQWQRKKATYESMERDWRTRSAERSTRESHGTRWRFRQKN